MKQRKICHKPQATAGVTREQVSLPPLLLHPLRLFLLFFLLFHVHLAHRNCDVFIWEKMLENI